MTHPILLIMLSHSNTLQSIAFLPSLATDLFRILFLALVTAMMNSFISLPSSLVFLHSVVIELSYLFLFPT